MLEVERQAAVDAGRLSRSLTVARVSGLPALSRAFIYNSPSGCWILLGQVYIMYPIQ